MSRQAQLPDGTILDFPDNTTDEVMTRVVKQHLAARLTPDKGTVTPEQAQQAFPRAAASMTVPDDRSGLQVAGDQAMNVLEGIGKFEVGIPGMIKDTAGAALDLARPGGMQRNVDRGVNMLQGGLDTAKPLINDTRNLARILTDQRSNIPRSTPDQQAGYASGIGQNVAPLLMGEAIRNAPSLAQALGESYQNRPTAGNAAALKQSAKLNFEKALAGAKDTPLDLTEPGRIAMRAQQLGTAGTTLPKMFSDYINKYPADPLTPMTYEIGRDFAANAGDLAYGERALANNHMQSLVEQFGRAMDTSNRDAAIKAGVGGYYDAAMKEFAQASNLAERNAIIKKWATRIAIGTALTGSGGAIVKAGLNLYGKQP